MVIIISEGTVLCQDRIMSPGLGFQIFFFFWKENSLLVLLLSKLSESG